jgi:hypothetical protein
MSRVIFLFILGGCSFFIPRDYIPQSKIVSNTQTYCEKNQGINLYNSNKKSQEIFLENLKRCQANTKLNDLEIAILWTLNQISIQPHMANPEGRLFVYLNYNGIEFIEDAQTGELPYFSLLIHLLNEYKNKKSLSDLFAIFNKHFNTRMPVNKEVETFLENYKKQIKENELLSQHYLRGDDVLKTGEKLPSFQLVLPKKFTPNTQTLQTYKYKSAAENEIECNYDMKLYESSVFLISEKQQRQHFFGLQTASLTLLAAASSSLSNIEISTAPYLKVSPSQAPVAFCRSKLNNVSKIAISSRSRDPGQHLFHLIQYGMFDTNQVTEVDQYIKFSHHLFLTKPLRILFESKRGDDEQLTRLQSFKIPIYNVEKIGEVWTGAHDNQGPNHSLLIDERFNGEFTCHR